jgi:hypothetical protein
MTIDITRTIHPDLLDEYVEQVNLAAGATAERTSPRRRRGRGAPAQADVSPPGDSQSVEPSDAPPDGAEVREDTSAPTAPEWLAAVDAATDPKEKLALLTRNLPREELTRDDVLAGLLGDLSNQRARRLIEDQQRQAEEQQRLRAYEQGDLYTLGQLSAAELQQRREAQEAQARQQSDPYIHAVRTFQASLPEDVQREVQGKQYDSFGAYLTAVQDAAIRHGVSEEVRKRSGALSKAELSQTVGSEMSPELDGGPAQSTREITDAQVSAMSLEEYDRFFDEKGRPRPGVRVRLERGIDVRRR